MKDISFQHINWSALSPNFRSHSSCASPES